MDFNKIPVGFGMALATNFQAMNAWSALSQAEQQDILAQVHQAGSEAEMHRVVETLASRGL